ncbi:hypothetical protein D3C71_1525570 [compost metagenome]
MLLHVQKGFYDQRAGVVEQHIRRAKFSQPARNGFTHLGGLRYIGTHPKRLTAIGNDLRREIDGGVAIQVDNDYLGPFRREQPACRSAASTGAAGDNGHFTGQTALALQLFDCTHCGFPSRPPLTANASSGDNTRR